MRVYNSIILSGLLVAGLVSNLKSFEGRSAQKLQEFNVQQHLLADAENSTDSSPIPHRGSGRFTIEPNTNLDWEQSQLLAKDKEKKGSDTEPSRGSGRLTAEAHNNIDLSAQQLLAKDKEKKGSDTEPSRGSGRLIEANLTNV